MTKCLSVYAGRRMKLYVCCLCCKAHTCMDAITCVLDLCTRNHTRSHHLTATCVNAVHSPVTQAPPPAARTLSRLALPLIDAINRWVGG